MTEIDRIADQMARAFDGDPWYGPALLPLLRGLDEATATRRVVHGIHNIHEVVLHIASWEGEVARRLRDGVAREPEPGDWPRPGSWPDAIATLEAAHASLLDAVRAFPPERLDEVVGEERDRPLGSGVSYYVMLHGIVQHTLAHTAQISLMRRALS